MRGNSGPRGTVPQQDGRVSVIESHLRSEHLGQNICCESLPRKRSAGIDWCQSQERLKRLVPHNSKTDMPICDYAVGFGQLTGSPFLLLSRCT